MHDAGTDTAGRFHLEPGPRERDLGDANVFQVLGSLERAQASGQELELEFSRSTGRLLGLGQPDYVCW